MTMPSTFALEDGSVTLSSEMIETIFGWLVRASALAWASADDMTAADARTILTATSRPRSSVAFHTSAKPPSPSRERRVTFNVRLSYTKAALDLVLFRRRRNATNSVWTQPHVA